MFSLSNETIYLNSEDEEEEIINKGGFEFPCSVDSFLVNFENLLSSYMRKSRKDNPISSLFADFMAVLETRKHFEAVYDTIFNVIIDCKYENITNFVRKIPNHSILVEIFEILLSYEMNFENFNFINYLIDNCNKDILFILEFLIISSLDDAYVREFSEILLEKARSLLSADSKSPSLYDLGDSLNFTFLLIKYIYESHKSDFIIVLKRFLENNVIYSPRDCLMLSYLIASETFILDQNLVKYLLKDTSTFFREKLVRKFYKIKDIDLHELFLGLFAHLDFFSCQLLIEYFSESHFLVSAVNDFINLTSEVLTDLFFLEDAEEEIAEDEYSLEHILRYKLNHFDDYSEGFMKFLSFVIRKHFKRFGESVLEFVTVLGLRLKSGHCAHILAFIFNELLTLKEDYHIYNFFVNLAEKWVYRHENVLNEFLQLLLDPPCQSLENGTFCGKICIFLDLPPQTSLFRINFIKALNFSLSKILDTGKSKFSSAVEFSDLLDVLVRIEFSSPLELIQITTICCFTASLFVHLLEIDNSTFYKFVETITNVVKKLNNLSDFRFILGREVLFHVVMGDAALYFEKSPINGNESNPLIEKLKNFIPESYMEFLKFEPKCEETRTVFVLRKYLLMWILNETLFTVWKEDISVRSRLGNYFVNLVNHKIEFLVHKTNKDGQIRGWKLFQENRVLWDITFFLCCFDDVSKDLCDLIFCFLIHLRDKFTSSSSVSSKEKVVDMYLNPIKFILKKIDRLDLLYPIWKVVKGINQRDVEELVLSLWKFSADDRNLEYIKNKKFSIEFRATVFDVLSRNIVSVAEYVGFFCV